MAGTVDSASEALSVGVQNAGDLMIMYGTTAFFIQVNDTLRIDPRTWAAPFLFPDTWCVMGGARHERRPDPLASRRDFWPPG